MLNIYIQIEFVSHHLLFSQNIIRYLTKVDRTSIVIFENRQFSFQPRIKVSSIQEFQENLNLSQKHKSLRAKVYFRILSCTTTRFYHCLFEQEHGFCDEKQQKSFHLHKSLYFFHSPQSLFYFFLVVMVIVKLEWI